MSNHSFISAIGSSSSSAIVASNDHDDNACSICIEPFTLQDPPTVTSCKHEYHLQCIIEWSQRSKECPICWQLFVLIDPACQELLATVEKERMLKTKNISSSSPRSIIQEESQLSSFDKQILSQLTEAANRPFAKTDNRISSSLVLSNELTMINPIDMANLDHISAISHVENQNTDPSLSLVSGLSSVPVVSKTVSRRSSSDSSVMSKLASASTRYKESICKRTRSLEKLIVRNKSMKELRKGVKREMNAGISTVTVMIERLDLAMKRLGRSRHASTSTATSSGF